MISEFIIEHDVQIAGTLFFATAVLHTFLAKWISGFGHKFPAGSFGENFFHFMGEIEVVFGFWAFLFLVYLSSLHGMDASIAFLDKVDFTEATFVFSIMCMAATKPVMQLTDDIIGALARTASRLVRVPEPISKYFIVLSVGPLLGSFITEPAAMTVCALALYQLMAHKNVSQKFLYATVAALFVNVSIGGVLTNFAAPPVIMVVSKWGWSTLHMLKHFGFKAIMAVALSASATTALFRHQILSLGEPLPLPNEEPDAPGRVPWWTVLVHLLFMLLVIVYHKHMSFFLPLFLIFLGWCEVTRHYQSPLKIRESLLVGLFLGGLVTLGSLQSWWLQPLLSQLSEMALYLGAISLTAVTDNAALTYLGSLVPTLSDSAKYFLLAGSVTGGGLTVIANAPNPVGNGILGDLFGEDGLNPLWLLLAALPWTIVAGLLFLL